MAQTDKVLELFFYDEDAKREQRFKPTARVPSFDLLEDLQATSDRYKKANVDRIAKADLPADIETVQDIASIKENPGATNAAIDLQADVARDERRQTLEMAQMIINVEKLTDAQRELVESPIESEFWRKQNMQALGVWVGGFCSDSGIR